MRYTTDTEVEMMFDDGQFDGLEFESASVDYDISDVLLNNPAEVNVVAEYSPPSQVPADVARRIDHRLTSETGRSVVVDVEFVRGQRSEL